MVFPVVIYWCESWTIKKDEWWRIDAFELWCWRRLLRVPWTARRLNKSILKEISPEYSLEGLMLKMKHQYFGHLFRRANSLEKIWCWERLKAGGEEDNKWCDGWMASLTQWTWVWASSRRWRRTGKPGVLHSMGSQRVRHDWGAKQQQQLQLCVRCWLYSVLEIQWEISNEKKPPPKKKMFSRCTGLVKIRWKK